MNIHTMNTDQLLDILPWDEPFDEEAMLFFSMSEHGWILPLLIDSAGVVLLGRERLSIAKAMGLHAAPCLFRECLTDAQQDAFHEAESLLLTSLPWDETTAEAAQAPLTAAGVVLREHL